METKDLLYQLFRLCEQYVSVEDFVEFEKKFAELSQKAGCDFYQIYYNDTFENLKNKYQRYNEIK